MSSTFAEQRKLPGDDVRENVAFSDATPYGLRRYANKVDVIRLAPQAQGVRFIAF
jgi:hypothetical protein